MTDSMAGMSTSTTTQEITLALADNYLGIGSTPALALASLAEDLMLGRLNADDLGATDAELLVAVGHFISDLTGRG